MFYYTIPVAPLHTHAPTMKAAWLRNAAVLSPELLLQLRDQVAVLLFDRSARGSWLRLRRGARSGSLAVAAANLLAAAKAGGAVSQPAAAPQVRPAEEDIHSNFTALFMMFKCFCAFLLSISGNL